MHDAPGQFVQVQVTFPLGWVDDVVEVVAWVGLATPVVEVVCDIFFVYICDQM